MRLLVSGVAAMLAIAACAPQTQTETPTPQPSPTPTPAPSAPSLASAEAEALRKLTFDYWDAFNAYDVEKVLSYLEESYRAERENQIRDDIGLLKMFRIKLGVTEHIPPTLTGPDEGQMFLLMKEPLGVRQIRMGFANGDGGWLVTFAEEVK